MPPLDPDHGVFTRRRITTIVREKPLKVSNAPSQDGTLQEQLASYRQWARNNKAGFVFGREDFVLNILYELAERLDRLEGTQQV